METNSLQDNILDLLPKRRGRKPKNTEEKKVWADSEYRKQYYKTYYETKRPKDYFLCECGTQCKQTHKHIHELTKHHILYLDMKERLTQQIQQTILVNNTCN